MSSLEILKKYFSDARTVYLIVFILAFAGALAPFSLPITPDSSVTKAYQTIESLQPGDLVFFYWDISSGNERGAAPGTYIALKHLLKRDVAIVLFALSAEGLYLADREHIPMIWNVTYTKDYPLYGTRLVDLGYVPTTRPIMFFTINNDIRALIKKDRYGTSLDNIPMLKDVNNFKTVKAIIYAGAGGSPQCFEDAIGAFKGPYGTKIVLFGEGETNTMAAAQRHAGNLDGVLYGSVAARQYEQLVGIKGYATNHANSMFFIGFLILIGCLTANFYTLSKKEEKF